MHVQLQKLRKLRKLRVSSFTSARISAENFGNNEAVAQHRGRVGQDLGGRQAGAGDVIIESVVHLGRVSKRLDTVDVEVGDLRDVVKHGGELRTELLDAVGGKFEPGEFGDVTDVGGGERGAGGRGGRRGRR